MKIKSLAASMLLLTAFAVAGGPKTNQADAAAAFERMKTLAGTWEADSQKGKVQSRYEVIANGTVLLEHVTVPGDGEMLTAYHLDGDRLVLTHYCSMGNVPHMAAKGLDPANNEIDFTFTGASNLNPGDGHMHDASYRLISNNQFDTTWSFVEDGKVKFTQSLHYNRVQ